ncbi:hypothetical protein ACC704_37285 [Rhizobium johnstonii]|uniref:hypothetical protein n=1 Tax=Rhizobium johnstonii TaxID=3019933 RepID=UPI003F9B8793
MLLSKPEPAPQFSLFRRFVSDARKLAEKSRRAEKERQTGEIGTLVKDPATGEYRLKSEGE